MQLRGFAGPRGCFSRSKAAIGWYERGGNNESRAGTINSAAAQFRAALDSPSLPVKRTVLIYGVLDDVRYTLIEPFPLGVVSTLVCAGILSRGKKKEEKVPAPTAPHPRFT